MIERGTHPCHGLFIVDELAEDDSKAISFDVLMYGIELAYLSGKEYNRTMNDLYKKVSAFTRTTINIPKLCAR